MFLVMYLVGAMVGLISAAPVKASGGSGGPGVVETFFPKGYNNLFFK